MPALASVDVERRLRSLQGWARRDDALHKEIQFRDFRQAMAFVDRVADEANAADHHPDICIRYNRVELALSTHSEGGITEKDFDLAAKIDAAG